jgi:Xaa-Pro dipeptidase
MLINRERALALMREHGVDAIVATSPINVRYLSDYACWLAPLFREYMSSPGASSDLSQRNFAVLPVEGEPVLIVDAMFAATAADSWVADIRAVGDAGFQLRGQPEALPDGLARVAHAVHPPASASAVDVLVAALAARGLTEARIGVELEALPAHLAQAISEQLPHARLADCTNLIRLIRAVKSREELGRLERAAAISEQAARDALAVIGPGIRTADVIDAYRAGVAASGADFDHFAWGPRGVGITTEGEYSLADGDVLYADFGCVYQGYFSDTGTTVCVGTPSDSLLALHQGLRACLRAGSAVMRPGATGSQICDAMWEALNAHGITHSFPHGHGVGMEVRDYPIIVPDNGLRLRDDCIDVPSDLPLEAGMVVNLEAAVFILGEASVHTEQSYLVADDGTGSITDQQRDEPVGLTR